MRKGDKITVPRSKEHRRKLSLAMIGNINHLGHHHTEETCKKLAMRMKGNQYTLGKKYGELTRGKDRIAKLGANNPAWQGGISFEPYGIEFNEELKERIRKRDNYTCQFEKCGAIQNSKKFPVHHIDYDKKNNAEFNLMTLCHSHHSKTNSNREFWARKYGHLRRRNG